MFRSSLPDFEAGANVIRTWELALVPGLLQTQEYAKAVWRAGQILDEDLVDRHVQARLARQAILSQGDPPTLIALIDEAALRKPIGGREVMRGQLLHLAKMATYPNITIQVVPDAAGAHMALTGGPFVILDFPEDPSLIYTVTATDSLWLEKPSEYQRYTLIFTHVMASALSPEESIRHIETLSDQLKNEVERP